LFSIRPAGPTDAPHIGRVQVDAWRDAYAGLLPADHLVGLDAAAQAIAWARRLGPVAARRATLIAIAEDETIGFSSFGAARKERPASEGEIYSLYVATDWRDRGVGRALLTGSFSALAKDGRANVSVWCLEGNMAAIGFYRHMGGKPIGQRLAERVGGLDQPIVGFLWQLPVK
jgi:ribosomal protein S18 acetylase RimI-like enzyme